MTELGSNPSSTHPPLPPTSEDDRFHRLRLLRSRRVGISTYKRLLIEHGTAQNALAALPEVARAAGVLKYEICPEGVVHAELKNGRIAGAILVDIATPEYPKQLRDLTDAPPFLWAIGNISLQQRPAISVVGGCAQCVVIRDAHGKVIGHRVGAVRICNSIRPCPRC